MDLGIDIMAIGLIISAAAYWFACSHLRHKPASDIKLLQNLLRGLLYSLTLVWETAKSNAMVFRIVFSRNIIIDPCLVYFKSNLKTNAARVTLANSITLTPGSITVALSDDLFCVHCLNRDIVKDIDSSVFVRQLKKIEGND